MPRTSVLVMMRDIARKQPLTLEQAEVESKDALDRAYCTMGALISIRLGGVKGLEDPNILEEGKNPAWAIADVKAESGGYLHCRYQPLLHELLQLKFSSVGGVFPVVLVLTWRHDLSQVLLNCGLYTSGVIVDLHYAQVPGPSRGDTFVLLCTTKLVAMS
jgi:hypothetical protein